MRRRPAAVCTQAGRLVVLVHQLAFIPIHSSAMVLPALHLGTLPLAVVAFTPGLFSPSSRPHGRHRLPVEHRASLLAGLVRARCTDGGDTGQHDPLRGQGTYFLLCRGRNLHRSNSLCRGWAPAGFRAAAGGRETDRVTRIPPTLPALC